MLNLNLIRIVSIAFLSLLIAACASSPYSQEGQSKTKALLDQQITNAQSLRGKDAESRIIYVGAALHSQSRAFKEDVLLGESIVKKMDSKALTFKMANPAFGQDASELPFATKESLYSTLEGVARIAQPNDKIVILLSSHGNVGRLAVNANNQELPGLSADDLASALREVSAWPTLILVSSCFSGSVIDAIKAPNRIIYTAADKDRASFGCNFHSKNTFFIEELLGAQWDSQQSLQANFLSARERVGVREKALNIGPPSMPRYQFGEQAKHLTEIPLIAWRSAPNSTKP
jgi:Peptidase C13 family